MELSREVLLANTRIRAAKAGGSGTILYSKEGKDGYSTYILTNNHVVDDCITVSKKWSPLLKRDIKMDTFTTVEAHLFKYQYQSRAIGATTIQCDIMTYDKEEDLALLKLRDNEPTSAVAKMYPKGEENKLRLGMSVVAVGAALGEPPIITAGILSQFAREIDNKEYWISTAPIIYGNSGGATYLSDTGEFIGVPARVAIAGSLFSASVVTHLGFIIPITRIYKFLDEQLFRFIYDANYTEEEEAKLREQKRKEEERKMAAREDTGQEQEEKTEEESSDVS